MTNDLSKIAEQRLQVERDKLSHRITSDDSQRNTALYIAHMKERGEERREDRREAFKREEWNREDQRHREQIEADKAIEQTKGENERDLALLNADISHIDKLDDIYFSNISGNRDVDDRIVGDFLSSFGQAINAVASDLMRFDERREEHTLALERDASQQAHESKMAEYTARYARVGFTAEELVRAGFSIKEAQTIVDRQLAGLAPQNEDDTAIFEKFDRWHAEYKK
jgi:hypothetical protein